MGYSTERYRSYVASQTGAKAIADRERAELQTERIARSMETALGTEAQLAGQVPGAVSPDVMPFLGSYSLDKAAVSTVMAHEKAYGIDKQLKRNLKKANQFMERARQAAQGGDIEGATNLRARAEAVLGDPGKRGGDWYPLLGGQDIKALFTFNAQPEVEAASRLASPTAKIVGEYVSEARGMAERGEEYEAWQKRITEPQERALAVAARDQRREAMDIARARGAAQSPYARQAIQAQAARQTATQVAQMRSQAVLETEQIRSELMSNAPGFAQAFVRGQSFIIDSYRDRATKITGMQAEFQNQIASRSQRFSEMSQAKAEASKARTSQIGMMAAGVALAAVTGFAGGFLAPAALAGGAAAPASTFFAGGGLPAAAPGIGARFASGLRGAVGSVGPAVGGALRKGD